MPISLILTPFDHFQFRPTLSEKCIPDLTVRHRKRLYWKHYRFLIGWKSLSLTTMRCFPQLSFAQVWDTQAPCQFANDYCPSSLAVESNTGLTVESPASCKIGKENMATFGN